MRMMTRPDREQLALFVLRVTLALFLLIWGVEKFVDPAGISGIFAKFYFLPGTPEIAILLLGIPQVLIALAMLTGLVRTLSYGLAFLLHLVSTLSTLPQILTPYAGGNHLFLAGVPVLAGFFAMFLLRYGDSWLALDPFLKARAERLRRERGGDRAS